MEYLERLKKLGYKPHEAVRIIECFIKYFNKDYLNAFITSIENERNLKNVSKPVCKSVSAELILKFYD